MRAFLAIAVGFGLVAAALGLIRDINAMPMAMQVVLFLFGAVLIYAGCYHLWLRIQRRRVYAGGRDRAGTAQLLRPIGEDDSSAYILFANRHSQWVLSVDLASIRTIVDGLENGLPATAYLGEDDRIYALDIGAVKSVPISPGIPYEGKLRERVEWVARKQAEYEQRHAEK